MGRKLMVENLIVCDHLWHTYAGGVTAIGNVSLSIRSGEVVGIIGQNGSGKTTLVKHFNGLLKPTHGTVTVDNLDVSTHGVHELSRIVGYVFQNPNHQLFATSVSEELAFGLTNLGLGEEAIQEAVERSVAFFHLESYQKTHPYRLSFPLRKMIALAAIYAMQPKVYILDEPTTGQDHVGVKLVYNLIGRLREQGATVIVVSHDMRLQAEATDRLIVLWQAEIIGDGSPKDIFSDDALLEKSNLHAPQITQLSRRLRRSGLPRTALSVEELTEPLAATM
jgi:energy-coupling factor transport system ATP-binding protein